MIVTVAEDLSVVAAVADDGSTMRLGAYNPETLAPWRSAAQAEEYARSCEGRPGFWTPPKTLAELKEEKRAAVSALLDAKLSAGYPHNFGEPYGVKVLQTRDIEDRTNWLTSAQSYGKAIAGGFGDVMGANFRTEDNINIVLSYSDGDAVLQAMAQWGSLKYEKSWALKDAIAEAEDEAALDAIDIESGW